MLVDDVISTGSTLQGMEHRRLGKTGYEISAIGFGAWAIGGWYWGGSDDAKAIAALHRALDVGMNFIDTAPVYGFGRSEDLESADRTIDSIRELPGVLRIVLSTHMAHLEYLEEAGDPATGLPIGGTSDNLKASVAGETHEYTDMYPGMASTAREEGFDEDADWFETLGKAERSHANRFQKALDNLD